MRIPPSARVYPPGTVTVREIDVSRITDAVERLCIEANTLLPHPVQELLCAACTVLNGANEEAVARFLREEITFGEIYAHVDRAMNRLAGLPARNIDEIFEADRQARAVVRG